MKYILDGNGFVATFVATYVAMDKNKKEKLKTNPYGVRFEKKKFDLIKSKEGLKTPQTVVNFLLDDYYMKNQMGLNNSVQNLSEQPATNVRISIPQKEAQKTTNRKKWVDTTEKQVDTENEQENDASDDFSRLLAEAKAQFHKK